MKKNLTFFLLTLLTLALLLPACTGKGEEKGFEKAETEVVWTTEDYLENYFVVPEMNAEMQDYYDRYILPLVDTELLQMEWSDSDYTQILDGPDSARNGQILMVAFEDLFGREETEELAQQNENDLPAEIVEDVLLEKFPFSKDHLHEILAGYYQPETQTYQYEPAWGGSGGCEGIVEDLEVIGGDITLLKIKYVIYSGGYELPAYPAMTSGLLTVVVYPDDSFMYFSVEHVKRKEAKVEPALLQDGI